MLHASELFEEAAHGTLAKWGVNPARSSWTSDKCTSHPPGSGEGAHQGIEFLFKKNKVEWLKGHASFEAADTVKVGDRTVRAKKSSSRPVLR